MSMPMPDPMPMPMMEMYFYYTGDVYFLCKSWFINKNSGLFFVACLTSFLAAVIVEFLSTRQIKNDFVNAAVYATNLFLSYMIMLVLMTFNFYLFITIMLGFSTGYIIFGFAPIEFKNTVKSQLY